MTFLYCSDLCSCILPLIYYHLTGSSHLTSREKKEVRGLAALGIICVVRPSWLEDCDQEKKEIPVLQKHLAYDLLLPKGLSSRSYRSSL